jgi:hypothetical protein
MNMTIWELLELLVMGIICVGGPVFAIITGLMKKDWHDHDSWF